MFTQGDLVSTLSQRVGIVVETKRLLQQLYCKVLWATATSPEWWHSDQLYDIET